MASDYRLIRADGTTIYLVNSSGTPTAGGSPYAPASTPFGIMSEWVPTSAPDDDGDPIEETIPLIYLGTSGSDALTAVQRLHEQFTARFNAPCVLYAQPNGGTAGYYELNSGKAQPAPISATKRGPGEGAANIAIDLAVRRSPYAAASALTSAINGTTFTNTHTGNVVTLGTLTGDMRYVGLPMNYSGR
jgi:hypothetical protein